MGNVVDTSAPQRTMAGITQVYSVRSEELESLLEEACFCTISFSVAGSRMEKIYTCSHCHFDTQELGMDFQAFWCKDIPEGSERDQCDL